VLLGLLVVEDGEELDEVLLVALAVILLVLGEVQLGDQRGYLCSDLPEIDA